MELVRVVVKRRSTDDSSELNINVQTTPIGSLLAGTTAIWIGAKLFRTLKRRWWLPVGAGMVMLALRQLSSRKEAQGASDEEE